MIQQQGSVFILHTDASTYCFRATEEGFLQHLYYGRRVDLSGGAQALIPQVRHLPGNAAGWAGHGQEAMALEFSAPGFGDLRETFVHIRDAQGDTAADFRLSGAEILAEKPALEGLPSAHSPDGQTLRLTLTDTRRTLTLELLYTTFDRSNVITRSARLINRGGTAITVERLMSAQVDFDRSDLIMTTFNGAWAREFEPTDTPCGPGTLSGGSRTGCSGSRANPFVILRDEKADEEYGNCWGFHLLYSGDHAEFASGSAFDGVRFLHGIQPEGFRWLLQPGESFTAPESAMTWGWGLDQMSQNCHRFIRDHVVRGHWQYRNRPILINSWESFYFRFRHRDLVRLARQGRELGAELFVLDDGWFGKRDSDTCSLGDWNIVHSKKLPHGLKGLADDITALGMDFGLWVEPEMVSRDSELFRAHPDWILGREDQAIGRNQYILDLSRAEVQDHLIATLKELFSSAPISYVKWDMNRIMTDTFSPAWPAARQGEVRHRYILGLYRVLQALTDAFPHVLFEGCASGGNRTDPGILCYMPQVWLSDNTDAMCRCRMQLNASYGYPQSVMGAHVSGSPNHQTLRVSSPDSRFQVAAFGLLGYECNLCELPGAEKAQVAGQIAFYKEHRALLQFGNFHRLRHGAKGLWQLMTAAPDGSLAITLLFQQENRPNAPALRLLARDLDPRALYRVSVCPVRVDMRAFGGLVNMISPIHIRQGSLTEAVAARFMDLKSETEDILAGGDMLMACGAFVKQSFSGTGYDDQTRVMGDFSGRLYLFQAQPPSEPGNDISEESEGGPCQ